MMKRIENEISTFFGGLATQKSWQYRCMYKSWPSIFSLLAYS